MVSTTIASVDEWIAQATELLSGLGLGPGPVVESAPRPIPPLVLTERVPDGARSPSPAIPTVWGDPVSRSAP
jgi:hypothetical protein